MPTAAINGINLSYSDTGGDGPAVVFSHGFLMDHSMFDRQVAALSPNYRVITWDERGHGGTAATGPFSYWDSAKDVLALLDHLGLERAVLAGMSQGGFLSLRAALLAPERVRALVLIDSQAGLEDPANAEPYEQLHQIWLDQGPAPVQDVVASIILGPGQWDDWYAKWAAADRDQFTLAFAALTERDDITGRLGEIGCPTLVIHGTADAAIPMERAEQVRDGLGGQVSFHVVTDGTHAANVSHPDDVNEAVLNFLRTLGE
ncbi:MAG TPA: alpha/beta hydrolase [Streptosporangiaceae bacterium]|jgi:3-oxoadipate enol-lactonase|nr:alpha/beta hydrolase [Streptosporangiaceae bacterium]